MDVEQKDKLKHIIGLHDEVAEVFKLVEEITRNIDLTSLNDTRYALRGVLDFLKGAVFNTGIDPADDTKDAYARSILGLRVCWHDIVDITNDTFKIYLDELSKKYGSDIVAKHIRVSDIRNIIRKIDDQVTHSRKHRERRSSIYEDITNTHLKKLVHLYREIEDAESIIAAEYKKESSNRFWTIFIAITSALVLLVTLYTAFK